MVTPLLIILIGGTASISNNLLDAIAMVESSGNPKAVGDNGKAVGLYQLHKEYVDDVNRILGRKEFTYEDRLDAAKSRQMVIVYLSHYGKGLSDIEKARIHNGGPLGHKKTATKKYGEKVKKYLTKR